MARAPVHPVTGAGWPPVANLHLRAAVLRALRLFFDRAGYLEVDTPCRIPAPAPEAWIEPEPAGDWYLHTSPELCMKRLLAAGLPRIYQICHCFRRQERGRRHLPEFTLLEWYTAEADYTAMMTQCERLLARVARAVNGGPTIRYRGARIDLTPPWPRLTVAEAFRRFAGLPVEKALAQHRFDELMTTTIEPALGMDPVFLVDYPAATAALARLKPSQPSVAERFELYVGGLELCNAFSELTDAAEQRRRFTAEHRRRRLAGRAVWPLSERFLTALDHMPAASGNALGVDRLVMLLADADRIDAVTAFVPEIL